jgi:hypothetical protein
MLEAQSRPPDRAEAASAVAHVQARVSSASRDDAREASGDCLPDGSGFLRVVLSGTLEHDIEWHNDDMECIGFNGTQRFAGVPVGADSQVDLNFEIQVAEGATGTDLPARVTIYDWGSGSNFGMEWGCTATVTEYSLIDENPAFRRYRLVAKGNCAEPAGQLSGPGAGDGTVTIGPFEFAGLAVWQGPRR